MKILCLNCTKADLVNASVQLPGTFRQEGYTVEMEGLKCLNCGYMTVEGKSMQEFGRLMADKYRRAHGLLTSNEIIALRHHFKDSQEAFAKRIGVGVASIKRWELGKIQDERSNRLILERTTTPLQGSNTSIRGIFITSGTMQRVNMDQDTVVKVSNVFVYRAAVQAGAWRQTNSPDDYRNVQPDNVPPEIADYYNCRQRGRSPHARRK